MGSNALLESEMDAPDVRLAHTCTGTGQPSRLLSVSLRPVGLTRLKIKVFGAAKRSKLIQHDYTKQFEQPGPSGPSRVEGKLTGCYGEDPTGLARPSPPPEARYLQHHPRGCR